MLPEARDSWVAQARNARGVGLQLSQIVSDMQAFATANDLTSLITESLEAQSEVLIGTEMRMSDVLAYVQLAGDISAFLAAPVVTDGMSRALFMLMGVG